MHSAFQARSVASLIGIAKILIFDNPFENMNKTLEYELLPTKLIITFGVFIAYNFPNFSRYLGGIA